MRRLRSCQHRPTFVHRRRSYVNIEAFQMMLRLASHDVTISRKCIAMRCRGDVVIADDIDPNVEPFPSRDRLEGNDGIRSSTRVVRRRIASTPPLFFCERRRMGRREADDSRGNRNIAFPLSSLSGIKSICRDGETMRYRRRDKQRALLRAFLSDRRNSGFVSPSLPTPSPAPPFPPGHPKESWASRSEHVAKLHKFGFIRASLFAFSSSL